MFAFSFAFALGSAFGGIVVVWAIVSVFAFALFQPKSTIALLSPRRIAVCVVCPTVSVVSVRHGVSVLFLPCRFALLRFVSSRLGSSHIASLRFVSHHTMQCHAMSCHVTPCLVMPCHAALCQVMPSYAKPCHAV